VQLLFVFFLLLKEQEIAAVVSTLLKDYKKSGRLQTNVKQSFNPKAFAFNS